MNRKTEYQSRIVDLIERIAWREQASTWIGIGRGVLFLLTVLAVIGSLTAMYTGWAAYLVPASPFLSLIVLAAYHETIQFRQSIDRARLKINKDQIRRIDRNWDELSTEQVHVPAERFHLVKDLDLFGPASLFKILNIAKTPLGIETTADWILNPAPPAEIKQRQEAVAALRDQSELREELQLLSQSVAAARTNPTELLEWADGPLWLEQRSWLKWFSRISAIALAVFILWFLIPGSPKMILGSVVGLQLTIHFALTVILSGSVHRIFNSVGYHQRDISAYVDLFLLSKKLPADQSETLSEIQTILATGDGNAVGASSQLQSIIGVAQMRRAGLMFLAYIFLQFFFLIDFHTLAWLESWHKKNATRLREWLTSLARWEAITSLSNLAYHQPDWRFPIVDRNQEVIEATAMGHPLIDDGDRVCNDVTVGPKKTILLVTGSNMSGKSTLLRSIGLNAVLAQAGSVVCCDDLKMPPMQIETSMRIGDSISDGVSFFMAELKRLRQITLEAERVQSDPDRVLLYLLDEILQGTNSRERQIAVIRVCEHLLHANAIGAISTHDLELAESDQIASRCETVHFREFFEESEQGKTMRFDYIMRHGISPTTNALKLLELVGLVDESTDE